MVSNYEFSAFFCMSSHSEATEWVSSACWTYRKLSFFLFFPPSLFILRLGFMSDCQTDIDLPSSCAITRVDKEGRSRSTQPEGRSRMDSRWLPLWRQTTVMLVRFCHTLRTVRFNTPLYKLLLQKKAGRLQTESDQTLTFTALTSVTIELCLILTSCFWQFPFSFTMLGVFLCLELAQATCVTVSTRLFLLRYLCSVPLLR